MPCGSHLLRRRQDRLGVAVCDLAGRYRSVDRRVRNVLWRSRDLRFPAGTKVRVRVRVYELVDASLNVLLDWCTARRKTA